MNNANKLALVVTHTDENAPAEVHFAPAPAYQSIRSRYGASIFPTRNGDTITVTLNGSTVCRIKQVAA